MGNHREHHFLKEYLGTNFSRIINSYLVKKDVFDKNLFKAAFQINNSLDMAKSYSNSTVHRFIEVSQIPIQLFSIWFSNRIGKVIQFPSFLSSTKNPDSFKAQTEIFRIKTCHYSNGRDISTLGFPVAMEEEVLFKSNSCFKIVDAKPELIFLEEVKGDFEEVTILYKDYFLEEEEIKQYVESQKNNRNIKSLTDQKLI